MHIGATPNWLLVWDLKTRYLQQKDPDKTGFFLFTTNLWLYWRDIHQEKGWLDTNEGEEHGFESSNLIKLQIQSHHQMLQQGHLQTCFNFGLAGKVPWAFRRLSDWLPKGRKKWSFPSGAIKLGEYLVNMFEVMILFYWIIFLLSINCGKQNSILYTSIFCGTSSNAL